MPTLRLSRESGTFVIELAASGKANAGTGELAQELAAAWDELEADGRLSLAVITGPPSSFWIEQGAVHRTSPDPSIWPLHVSKPVIAAIEGECFCEGFELALACDFRVAGKSAVFGFPSRGSARPFWLAPVLLPRMTFAGLGLELLLTGRRFSAEEMLRARLVTRVVPEGKALVNALEMAARLRERFSRTAWFHKRRLLRMSGMPLVAALSMAREVVDE